MRVLEVARSVVDDVSKLCVQSPAIATDYQLRKSVKSVPSNIREAFGRRKGPERNQFLRFARGSAEETDEHLRAHLAPGHIGKPTYWRLHHRLVVCIKMLNALMKDRPQ